MLGKDSLTLNISSGSQTILGDNSQKSKKGDQRRKRKGTQETKSKFASGEDSDSDVEYYKKLKREAVQKSKSTAQHISSLFAHNPEIPEVESKEVNPVREAVFSNDLFKDLPGVHPFTIKNLEESLGVTKVTTVQKLALPVLLSGRDALIRSQTGSGKTLAYAVPIVETLQKVRPKLSRSDGVRVVVVLPSRELALQTYDCFVKLIKSFQWLVPGLVVGGEKRKSEKARLRKGVNILVGTPGRLNDHAQNTECLKLDQVQWLVLDEADCLLDSGYEKEITSLVERIEQCKSAERQTVLLSATLTTQVERLAGLALSSPARLDASQAQESELVIPQTLAQYYIVTPAKLRLVTLAAFIHWKCQVCKEKKLIVFMATQDMVDYHTELLSTVLSHTAELLSLHGSMNQQDRTRVFHNFKNAESGVLLCTDVAARGLDLPSVDWIVQYTSPATPADYVHRVGRTARVGHSGSSVLFLVPSETSFISHLQDKRIRLKEEEMVKCLYNLQTLHWEDEDQRVSSGMENVATALQLRFETAVLEEKNLHDLACKAYVSWVRFYASYPKEVRECFNFKEIHLGHFAKSFALRDPPTSIGGLGKPTSRKPGFSSKRFGSRGPYQERAPPLLKTPVSEFASGLEPLNKKKKKNKS